MDALVMRRNYIGMGRKGFETVTRLGGRNSFYALQISLLQSCTDSDSRPEREREQNDVT